MSYLRFGVLGAVVLAALPATGYGQEPAPQLLPPMAGPLAVSIDRAAVFAIPQDTFVLVVGNPAIADVTKTDRAPGLAVVTGKSFGQTNVILLDERGRQLSSADIRVEATKGPTFTVQHGNEGRITYSCTPRCSPALSLGDNADAFQRLSGQMQQRQSIAAPPGGQPATAGAGEAR